MEAEKGGLAWVPLDFGMEWNSGGSMLLGHGR